MVIFVFIAFPSVEISAAVPFAASGFEVSSPGPLIFESGNAVSTFTFQLVIAAQKFRQLPFARESAKKGDSVHAQLGGVQGNPPELCRASPSLYFSALFAHGCSSNKRRFSFDLRIVNNNLNIMSKFSDRLRQLRKKKGFTQPSLAEKLGVSKGAVGNWEVASNMPDRSTLRTLADMLGTTESFLSGETDLDEKNKHGASTEYTLIRVQLLTDSQLAQSLREAADAVEKPASEEKIKLFESLYNVVSELHSRILYQMRELKPAPEGTNSEAPSGAARALEQISASSKSDPSK